MEPAELISAIRAGSREAFDEMCGRYYAPLTAYARLFLNVGQLRQQAPPCVQLPLLLPGTYRKHRLRLLRSRPESGHRKALLARSAHEHQRGDRSPPGQMPRGLFAELPARVLPPRDQRTDGDCAEHGRKPYLPCPEATAGKIVEIGANSAAVFHFFTK